MSADIIAKLTEVQIVTMTLYGEARGESVFGQIAVGCVIRNRYASGRWGRSYAQVCLAPWQFSCWIPQGGQANYEHVMAVAQELGAATEIPDNPPLKQCAWVAMGIIGNWIQDVTRGATHYYAPDAMGDKVPAWAVNQTPVAEIAGHRFFTRIA